MKRVIYGVLFVLLFVLFIGNVEAYIDNDTIAAVANSGKITTDYKNSRGDFKSFNIVAKSNSDNGGEITMSVVVEEFDKYGNSLGDKNYSASLIYGYDSEQDIYIASQTFDEEAMNQGNFFLYKELYSLFPYWCVEASDKWGSKIEPLFDKETTKLDQLRTIIDKCYMSEYGVCFTVENSNVQKTSTYIAKGEKGEKTADYVISRLKQNRRDKNQQKFLSKLAVVFVVLVVLYVVANSYRKQAEAEEYAKKKSKYDKIQIN